MLDDLHRVIASARYKINSRKAAQEDLPQSSKVLEFPSFS
jgi:hypothetical protein